MTRRTAIGRTAATITVSALAATGIMQGADAIASYWMSTPTPGVLDIQERVEDGLEPQSGRPAAPAAETTPEGPGHTFNHRHEAHQDDPFSYEPGMNAFTFQWPDGTASWCFTYQPSNRGWETPPTMECKDVPDGWDA